MNTWFLCMVIGLKLVRELYVFLPIVTTGKTRIIW